MTELVLIVLTMVKFAFLSAGTIGVLVVLCYMFDLLIEEYQIYQEKRETSQKTFESLRVRHHKKHVLKTKLDEAWSEYFFEDIGRHRVPKDAAFVHPYIAVRPRLHRYTIHMETRHA